MVDAIIGAMVGAVVGVIGFVVTRQVISAQDTTKWSAAERAIIDIIPLAVGVLVLIGVFTALQVR